MFSLLMPRGRSQSARCGQKKFNPPRPRLPPRRFSHVAPAGDGAVPASPLRRPARWRCGPRPCIQWTSCAETRFPHHGRVDLRRFHAPVPRQVLHRADSREEAPLHAARSTVILSPMMLLRLQPVVSRLPLRERREWNVCLIRLRHEHPEGKKRRAQRMREMDSGRKISFEARERQRATREQGTLPSGFRRRSRHVVTSAAAAAPASGRCLGGAACDQSSRRNRLRGTDESGRATEPRVIDEAVFVHWIDHAVGEFGIRDIADVSEGQPVGMTPGRALGRARFLGWGEDGREGFEVGQGGWAKHRRPGHR